MPASMAKNWILPGEVAERTEAIEIRCHRCDRHDRLSIARLMAEHGPAASMGEVLREQIRDCPKRDEGRIQDRCDPYSPNLPALFARRAKSDTDEENEAPDRLHHRASDGPSSGVSASSGCGLPTITRWTFGVAFGLRFCLGGRTVTITIGV